MLIKPYVLYEIKLIDALNIIAMVFFFLKLTCQHRNIQNLPIGGFHFSTYGLCLFLAVFSTSGKVLRRMMARASTHPLSYLSY